MLELMHNRIPQHIMAKPGEKDFSNEKNLKKVKKRVEDANKIVEEALKEI